MLRQLRFAPLPKYRKPPTSRDPGLKKGGPGHKPGQRNRGEKDGEHGRITKRPVGQKQGNPVVRRAVGVAAGVGAGVIAGVIIWEGIKWGVAILTAPATAGVSLAVAAAVP